MNTPTKIEAGIGFCLLFSNSEYKLLKEILHEFDYPITKDGLKEFILAENTEASPETKSASMKLGETLRNVIRNNPEASEALAKDGINLARNIFKKKFKL